MVTTGTIEQLHSNSLTRACKLKNDLVKIRLPIQIGLLELVLFETKRSFSEQPYLKYMYSSAFLIQYYGLFRIGEITQSPHTIKAKDVHKCENKNKLLFVLYTSKTHGLGSKPQKISIIGNNELEVQQETRTKFLRDNTYNKSLFCPVFNNSKVY